MRQAQRLPRENNTDGSIPFFADGLCVAADADSDIKVPGALSPAFRPQTEESPAWFAACALTVTISDRFACLIATYWVLPGAVQQ